MSNVPDHHKHLEDLSPDEIEKRCQAFERIDPKSISDDDLEMIVSLMTIHRRKTAGPAKPKTDRPAKQKVTLADFMKGLKPA